MSEIIGRPTVMTPQTIEKLEEAFLMGCGDLEACLFADISKTALYDYQQANPDFAERKEKLKENPILIARGSVVRAMETDGDLALKYLERKKKDEFSTKQDVAVDHTTKGESLIASASARLSDMKGKILENDAKNT